MHCPTNFHDISSAFLSIHSVNIAYTLLWLLNVLGEMGTDFADHHVHEVHIPVCYKSTLRWQQSRHQTFSPFKRC